MLRNWPILLLATVLVVIIGVSCYTDSSYQDKQDGTGNSSSSVNVAQNETSHSSQETQQSIRPVVGANSSYGQKAYKAGYCPQFCCS